MRKFIEKKISIVIPTLNEESNIIQLINEINNELSDIDYEIIIVDDGSTDATAKKILNEFKDNQSVKLIQRQHDKGLVQSIKFGLQSITGEYFVVMDGDRQHSPSNIKTLLTMKSLVIH